MTYHQLTQEERYLIAAQRMCGYPPAQIADVLGRHRSTVTREPRRNATHHDGDYRAEKAHSYAVARRRRCRRRARFSAADMAQVARLIRRKWSAEQIAGTLKKRGTLNISRENFNGLLRQYFPKGVCMRNVTQVRCDQIADDLNHRPRKRHGFETPATLYHRN